MIISASRRTDIPRFHFDWLLRRFEEGFALVRNPMVRTQVSRVSLAPDAVDCVAFWTKNPAVLLARKDELDRAAPAPYFVQFTLNAYGSDVEAGLPRKAQLLDTFRKRPAPWRANRQRTARVAAWAFSIWEPARAPACWTWYIPSSC